MLFENALRVFGQLPDEPAEEWLTLADGAAGGLMTMPVDANDRHNGVVWLRWCALADGAPAGAVLRDLFAKTQARLRGDTVTHIMCGISSQHWLLPYLRDAGFTLADELITLQRGLAEAPQPLSALPITLRPATPADLSAIAQLDALAFAPAWRYSRAALADGFLDGRIFRVAVWGSNLSDRPSGGLAGIAGYTFADLSDNHAHLIRIAVHPSNRRGGAGKLLLADGMAAAQKLGAQTYSLNVQKSNIPAQNLYDSFGFRRIGSPLKIMSKNFDGRRMTDDGI